MVTIRFHGCLQDGWKRLPSYKVEGSTSAAFCQNHAKGRMVTVSRKRSSWAGRVADGDIGDIDGEEVAK